MSRPAVPLHAKHPSFPAIPDIAPQPVRTVVVLAFDDLLLLNAAGPLEVFAAIPRVLGGAFIDSPPYRLLIASAQGGQVMSISGISVSTCSLEQIDQMAPQIDTLIVAGGPGMAALEADERACDWLRVRSANIRRLCSIGTGTFALAAAGLLDGRQVVTHWKFAAELQARYPAVRCQTDALYLHDDNLWTCGGATAGIDLALGLVEQDLGAQAALSLARYFTVFLWRGAEQPQLSASLNAQSSALRTDPDVRVARLHAWIAGHLNEDLRVERLAEQFGMSPRHFARAYVAATGQTPAQAVEQLRLEAACRLLKTSHEPIKRIAETVGFGREERMRRTFQKHLATSPNGYRNQTDAPEPLDRRQSSRVGIALEWLAQ
ncbi:helix-turn-helix domain-containing protein [Pseudomonas sp. MBT-17]|jgi:transcriptional regulator GlxA family with amidase domain|uniref:GlxA family transcriptional regulator n=1 Tax=Pseudomonas sp. P1.31 TaxID=1699311 RepID=UPI0012E10A78|nr:MULTISPECIES: helix-turn-helix domain-containing protein [Pseudomonas]MBS4086568.1 helix-turn-helix domain-containing protein [Pseudomonas rustica]